MATREVADPSAPCLRVPDIYVVLEEGTADEVLPMLKNDHVQRVIKLRDELCARATDPERYELCVQIRDELLEEDSGAQLW